MVTRSLYLILVIFLCGLAACDSSTPVNPTPDSSRPAENPAPTSVQSATPEKEETILEKASTGDVHATRYLLDQNRLEKDEGKLAEIRKAILQSAEAGNHQAQLELGSLVQEGKVSWNEPEKAFANFEIKAVNGDSNAALFLHYFYQSGIGTKVDEEQSLRWLKKAVEDDHSAAQYLLANRYLSGNGTEKNPDEAKELLRKSANQNFPSSQTSLANLYRVGALGVGPNYDQAFYWAVKADENNDPGGSLELGILYDTGRGVDKNRKIAKNLYKKALDQGFVSAYARISGWHYAKQDFHKSLEYAKKGFERGDPRSTAALSLHFIHGSGVEQNYAEAKKLAAIAAEKNDSFGQYIIGIIYFHGFGEKNDKKIAYEWFKKSSQGNDPESLNFLGGY
jgi:TPR repeat protein